MRTFIKKWSSSYKCAVKVCLLKRCVFLYPVPQHVLMAIWAYRERGSAYHPKCVQKDLFFLKRERKVDDSSHSGLCWYKWRQLFWSHLRVWNSQTEACVSWCLTVQTQVRTTKMKREQNISKRHIKRESSSSWCLWTHSKLEKKKKIL